MFMKDIVTVMTAAGEFVGRLVKIDETGIVLYRPRLITFEGESMGFARGIVATGKVDPEEVTILAPIFMTPTDDEVSKAWQTATTGIIL
jgi:hypothetical protein|tara:strand:- start:3418 stop:3684 length:267 start_codon:yes stop_codon:yes gene_type:complete